MAVGASIATAGRSSSVAAKVLDDAVVNSSTLAVGASGAGQLTTTSTALGGGIVAGVGADAEAHENSTVLAEIGSGSSITTSATGVGTLVTASITPNLSSTAIGVSVGGGAVGVAVAKSTVGATVTADVGDNAVFSGGALAVTAMALVPTSGTTTYAWALAGGGGSLIGAQGSLAMASENATVSAYGGTGITLPNGDVVIAAENDSSQYAQATGLSTGFLALGATVAQTSSSAHTYAYLGAPVDMDTAHLNHTDYTGILQITATGKDTNVSNATVGAGGTYAGAAAVATTSSTAVTDARFDGGTTDDTVYFGGLSINAKHTTNYAASGDAYQASTAGVSAGKAQNDVNSTTTAEIGNHLIINSAGGNMVVISNDIVNQAGGGARSGSGGTFSGAAALSDSHVTQTVTTNIGSGTVLSLNGDPRTSAAVINIEAYNTLNTNDTASLATASFFAGGGAESNMTANATLAVNINARELFSVGKIYIGSAAKMAAANNANASLYGAIAGVGASTNTWVHANQAVNVGNNAKVEAWGQINIFAGMSGDTIIFSSVQATATTVVYNNTAIPISTLYRGTANADDTTSLTLANTSSVLGVQNISLGATQGQVTASGNGSNYNPYLDIFSAKNSDNHSHTSGTGDVALNGLVVAGINNDITITIDIGASTPTASTTSPYSSLLSGGSSTPTLEYVADVDHFNPMMSWNHQVVQYTIVGGFNPYQSVVNQLVTLTGLTETQIRSQLAAATPAAPATMSPSGTDPTGDFQRQINALIQQAPYTSDSTGNAFAFGDMLVSAGNVSILAQKLTGNSGTNPTAPAVIARSSPMIKIENRGLDFMDLANLTVTNVTGGNITYRQIDHVDPDSHSNVTFTATPSATPIIDISATYNRLDPSSGLGVDQNGNQLTRTPDIYFDGAVNNENGLLKITNNLGSIVASQSLNAATVQMVAPNGSFVFLGGIGSFYTSNHDVLSQWAGVEFKPADDDTLTAVMAAATYLGAYGDYATAPHIAGGAGHPYFYYCCVDGNNGVQQTAANSTIFTARMLELYYDGLSLYSAILLPMGSGAPGSGNPNAGSVGSTTVLGQMEGPTRQTITTAPWERDTYTGQGVYSNSTYDYTTTSTDSQGNTTTTNHTSTFYSPFNCAGCSAYFQVVNIQPDVITPRTAQSNSSSNWSSTAPTGYQTPDNAPFIFGKAIIISAGVININGTIQSGTSSDYSVDIGGTTLTAINDLKSRNAGADFAQAQVNARNGSYYDITASATTEAAGDIKIGVKYNALTDQILVNGVVQGSGGYVYLNGKIISTSTQDGVSQGTIAVKGGAGSITVNNTTGLQLVTNTINTGVSAPSVIEIVDQLKQQTTWYVYNPSAAGGQQVSTYQTSGVNASQYTDTMLTSLSGTAGIQYATKANMFYQWVDTATLDRPTDSTQFDYGWHYTPNAATGQNWTRTISLVSDVQQAQGGGGSTGPQISNFQEVVTATGSYHTGGGNTHPEKCCGADGQYNWYQEIYDHLTLTLTNTVKASNPINISFSGGGNSTVLVTSNSGIVVNGPINNLSGTTTVNATGANSAITSGTNANNPMISGRSVILSADGGIGTIGANGVPVQVQVYGGSLTASSIDHDIAIAAIGSLSINQVMVNSAGSTPQGSVFISATGDINSASPYDVANPSRDRQERRDQLHRRRDRRDEQRRQWREHAYQYQSAGDPGDGHDAGRRQRRRRGSRQRLGHRHLHRAVQGRFAPRHGPVERRPGVPGGRRLGRQPGEHPEWKGSGWSHPGAEPASAGRLGQPRPAQRQRRHQRRQQLPVDGDVGLQRLLPAQEHRVHERQHLQPDFGGADGAAGASGRQARHRPRERLDDGHEGRGHDAVPEGSVPARQDHDRRAQDLADDIARHRTGRSAGDRVRQLVVVDPVHEAVRRRNDSQSAPAEQYGAANGAHDLQCELHLHARIDREGLRHHHRGRAMDAEPARLHRLVVGRRRRTAADRRERRGQCQRQPDHALRAARFGRQFGRAAGVHFHQRRFLVADDRAEGIARDRRPRSAHCRRGHRPDDPCRDLYGQPVAAEPRRRRQPDRDLGQGADECLSRQQEQPYARRYHCELRPDRGRAGQRHRSDRPWRRQARRRDQHHRRRRRDRYARDLRRYRQPDPDRRARQCRCPRGRRKQSRSQCKRDPDRVRRSEQRSARPGLVGAGHLCEADHRRSHPRQHCRRQCNSARGDRQHLRRIRLLRPYRDPHSGHRPRSACRRQHQLQRLDLPARAGEYLRRRDRLGGRRSQHPRGHRRSRGRHGRHLWNADGWRSTDAERSARRAHHQCGHHQRRPDATACQPRHDFHGRHQHGACDGDQQLGRSDTGGRDTVDGSLRRHQRGRRDLRDHHRRRDHRPAEFVAVLCGGLECAFDHRHRRRRRLAGGDHRQRRWSDQVRRRRLGRRSRAERIQRHRQRDKPVHLQRRAAGGKHECRRHLPEGSDRHRGEPALRGQGQRGHPRHRWPDARPGAGGHGGGRERLLQRRGEQRQHRHRHRRQQRVADGPRHPERDVQVARGNRLQRRRRQHQCHGR
ncbi:hypothetical protein ACVWWG_006054 [Bradyrhizobium sp. LB7.2]